MAISRCCGCCSLQTGTIIIGFLYFVCGAVAVILQGISLSSFLATQPSSFKEMDKIYWAITISILLLTYAIIHLMITGLLIAGTIRRIAGYVFLFLCMNFGNIVGACLYVVLSITLATLLHASPLDILILCGSIMIGMCILLYLWFVVYYFYQELIADKYKKLFQPNTINYSHPVIPGMVYSS